MNKREIARKILNYFGPKGKRWIQGQGNRYDSKYRVTGCCLSIVTSRLARTHVISGVDEEKIDQEIYNRLGRTSVILWNDAPDRTFADVRRLLVSIRDGKKYRPIEDKKARESVSV